MSRQTGTDRRAAEQAELDRRRPPVADDARAIAEARSQAVDWHTISVRMGRPVSVCKALHRTFLAQEARSTDEDIQYLRNQERLRLEAIMNRCFDLADSPRVEDSVKVQAISGAIRTSQELRKLDGLDKPVQVRHSGNLTVDMEMAGLTDEALDEALDGYALPLYSRTLEELPPPKVHVPEVITLADEDVVEITGEGGENGEAGEVDPAVMAKLSGRPPVRGKPPREEPQ